MCTGGALFSSQGTGGPSLACERCGSWQGPALWVWSFINDCQKTEKGPILGGYQVGPGVLIAATVPARAHLFRILQLVATAAAVEAALRLTQGTIPFHWMGIVPRQLTLPCRSVRAVQTGALNP